MVKAFSASCSTNGTVAPRPSTNFGSSPARVITGPEPAAASEDSVVENAGAADSPAAASKAPTVAVVAVRRRRTDGFWDTGDIPLRMNGRAC
ncbi:hypothetical protein GCM10009789_04310 [Kribbella sancticallisti]|uniref:Uncharacterized protein n=1 Tax=Kribbella sancticallisti TaxID=460087 RepID=A0ABP4N470_9ACTN